LSNWFQLILHFREKEKVNLTCEARGYPEPQVRSQKEQCRTILCAQEANDHSLGLE
jgi:hypothetical protein